MELTEAILEKFKAWHEEAWNDADWADETRQRMKRRKQVSKEIGELLGAFAADKVSLADFKVTFDKKTRKEWGGFGLKGMSGAMFLNMMTLHMPDQADLAARLKSALAVPGSEGEGRQKMSAFYAYLNDAVSQHHVPLRKVQPRRTPFLLSALWHMQDRNSWPVFYQSARAVLGGEGLLPQSNDPIDEYFRFRSVWLQLREALGIPPWDLELLCARISGKGGVEPPPKPFEPIDEPPTGADPAHAEVQWLLAELGQKLGCKVWIAANDHGKDWKGQKLKTLSIPSLPNLGMGEDAQKIINLIDVIWLKGGKQVVAAFEVESTTSIYSGLLRMADLITTCPNLNILCFIVVPNSRETSVVKQLSRPTFQSLELNSRCGFFTIERLKEDLPAMMKWAKDPASIKELAKFVGDLSE